MTKTTEELKREMYGLLAELKGRVTINYSIKDMMRGIDEFGHGLEDYLESLIHLRNCYERLACDYTTKSVKLAEERDELRNKLQAFEFANKSAGEMLQAANEKIKRQRQSIGQLKNDRNNAQSLAAVNYEKYQKARIELSELRKAQCSTSGQSCWEKLLCATCGGTGVVLAMSQYGGSACGMNCPACRPAMRVEK